MTVWATRASPKIVSNITINYPPKPAEKPPVARPNGDAVRSSTRPASLLPLIAGGGPPVTSIHRETIHVKAYCIFDRRSPQCPCPHGHHRCARQRAGKDRDGRRRCDVPLEEHHPERRQLQGPHHAGCGGEGPPPGRDPPKQKPPPRFSPPPPPPPPIPPPP